MKRFLPWLLIVWLAAPARAADIDYLDTGRHRDRYRLCVVATVHAPAPIVLRRLTDFQHLRHISPRILHSRLLERRGDGLWLVEVESRHCVGWFCKRLTQVQRVEALGDRRLRVTDVAGASAFVEARAVWQVQALGPETTRLRFDGRYRPGFWVPPWIGPPLVRRSLIRTLQEILRRLEAPASTTVPKDAGALSEGLFYPLISIGLNAKIRQRRIQGFRW